MVPQVFDPVIYGLAELSFIRKHLGEPPVAVFNESLPPNVNPAAVQPALAMIYDLVELEKHRGVTWVGVEAVKKCIDTYLFEYRKWQEMRKRGAPRFPSMHYWDARGRPHRYGTGSDASRVTHFIDSDGKRNDLRLPLNVVENPEFIPEWLKGSVELPEEFPEDKEIGRISCPLCNFTTTYDVEQQSSRNTARGRMAAHCTSTNKDPDLHRELKLRVFG